MTAEQLAAAVLGGAAGALVALVTAERLIKAMPVALVRANVAGRPVPAVLGIALSVAALFGLCALIVGSRAGWEAASTGRVGIAAGVVVAVMGLAGYADDRRGDEEARGFKGHLRAALSGRVTGGVLKVVSGLVAGLIAGLLTGEGWWVVECALLVALTANLVNLLDRAPGRAGKASAVIAAPLIVLGMPQWVVASSGALGALAGCLRADLSERAMLGDAGANPLGGILGLGLALALGRPARIAALVVLAGLNLGSERWSYSRVIERTSWLRRVDRLGRRSESL